MTKGKGKGIQMTPDEERLGMLFPACRGKMSIQDEWRDRL